MRLGPARSDARCDIADRIERVVQSIDAQRWHNLNNAKSNIASMAEEPSPSTGLQPRCSLQRSADGSSSNFTLDQQIIVPVRESSLEQVADTMRCRMLHARAGVYKDLPTVRNESPRQQLTRAPRAARDGLERIPRDQLAPECHVVREKPILGKKCVARIAQREEPSERERLGDEIVGLERAVSA
ncbi:MAG: hypothetical protein ACKO3W_12155, partial [bacterium]